MDEYTFRPSTSPNKSRAVQNNKNQIHPDAKIDHSKENVINSNPTPSSTNNSGKVKWRITTSNNSRTLNYLPSQPQKYQPAIQPSPSNNPVITPNAMKKRTYGEYTEMSTHPPTNFRSNEKITIFSDHQSPQNYDHTRNHINHNHTNRHRDIRPANQNRIIPIINNHNGGVTKKSRNDDLNFFFEENPRIENIHYSSSPSLNHYHQSPSVQQNINNLTRDHYNDMTFNLVPQIIATPPPPPPQPQIQEEYDNFTLEGPNFCADELEMMLNNMPLDSLNEILSASPDSLLLRDDNIHQSHNHNHNHNNNNNNQSTLSLDSQLGISEQLIFDDNQLEPLPQPQPQDQFPHRCLVNDNLYKTMMNIWMGSYGCPAISCYFRGDDYYHLNPFNTNFTTMLGPTSTKHHHHHHHHQNTPNPKYYYYCDDIAAVALQSPTVSSPLTSPLCSPLINNNHNHNHNNHNNNNHSGFNITKDELLSSTSSISVKYLPELFQPIYSIQIFWINKVQGKFQTVRPKPQAISKPKFLLFRLLHSSCDAILQLRVRIVPSSSPTSNSISSPLSSPSCANSPISPSPLLSPPSDPILFEKNQIIIRNVLGAHPTPESIRSSSYSSNNSIDELCTTYNNNNNNNNNNDNDDNTHSQFGHDEAQQLHDSSSISNQDSTVERSFYLQSQCTMNIHQLMLNNNNNNMNVCQGINTINGAHLTSCPCDHSDQRMVQFDCGFSGTPKGLRPHYTVFIEDGNGQIITSWNVEVYNFKYETMITRRIQIRNDSQSNSKKGENPNFERVPIPDMSYILASFDATRGRWFHKVIYDKNIHDFEPPQL